VPSSLGFGLMRRRLVLAAVRRHTGLFTRRLSSAQPSGPVESVQAVETSTVHKDADAGPLDVKALREALQASLASYIEGSYDMWPLITSMEKELLSLQRER
jgi:hypothetical protein